VRLDLAYPTLRLGIEADGRRWHGGVADFERGRIRSNLLVHLGWRVLQFTWADVTRRPAQVAASVARELSGSPPSAG
jgi:very-short-patch-repair endonuclease